MSAQFKFKLRRAQCDQSGYYYVRWDLAVPITVIAPTEQAAYRVARVMSGEPSRGLGWGWTFRLDGVEQIEDVEVEQ